MTVCVYVQPWFVRFRILRAEGMGLTVSAWGAAKNGIGYA